MHAVWHRWTTAATRQQIKKAAQTRMTSQNGCAFLAVASSVASIPGVTVLVEDVAVVTVAVEVVELAVVVDEVTETVEVLDVVDE